MPTHGTTYGAFNYDPNANSGSNIGADWTNITQAWSPVNMDACCYQAGCVHPAAWNFDLIGYRRDNIYDPTVNHLSPVFDIYNEAQHTSCADCAGQSAANWYRAGPLFPQLDDETWDGTLGVNSNFSGINHLQTLNFTATLSAKAWECCCFYAGCNDPNSYNGPNFGTGTGMGGGACYSNAVLNGTTCCGCPNNSSSTACGYPACGIGPPPPPPPPSA